VPLLLSFFDKLCGRSASVGSKPASYSHSMVAGGLEEMS